MNRETIAQPQAQRKEKKHTNSSLYVNNLALVQKTLHASKGGQDSQSQYVTVNTHAEHLLAVR